MVELASIIKRYEAAKSKHLEIIKKIDELLEEKKKSKKQQKKKK